MSPNELSERARYKGTRSVVIQDIILKTDNVKFNLERYLDKGRLVEARLPLGYTGSEFGPGVRALVLMLFYESRVTQRKIRQILLGIGVDISLAEVARMTCSLSEELKEEQEEAKLAAVDGLGYLQADDTGAKISNESAQTFVVCNELFTGFHTSRSKNRLTFIDALRGIRHEDKREYLINRVSLSLLQKGGLRKKFLKELKIGAKYHKIYREAEFEKIWIKRLKHDGLPLSWVYDIKSACAVAAFRNEIAGSGYVLITDDATNFKSTFRNHALCWVHEIRRYRAIFFITEYHRSILDEFLKKVTRLYRRLKKYCKENFAVRPPPDNKEAKEITAEFREIFSTPTGFNQIDQLLPLSLARERGLLVALKCPWTPLHNNTSELDLRERVIKRGISISNQSEAGVIAWDYYMGLAHTCRKNRIHFWAFLKDRLQKKGEIPPLATLIRTSQAKVA